jgi:glutamate synthase domain-containing protein 1
MCGIVGLFAKRPAVEERLGAHLGAMLSQMADRGPDSAGVALYRDPAPLGHTKLSLYEDGRHEIVVVEGDAEAATARIRAERPDAQVMSAGSRIEIVKEIGDPRRFVERFGLASLSASHGLGHTRMATESRVTTEGAHPFSTGLDLCLVHNGSLSNHNALRRRLRHEGIGFQTENDTEVAAGYLEWRMREGDGLQAALEACLVDLDGFYTFAVGTADGFAVLRDPIACKPAVMAENDDWVAMASEYRAIAVLPGAESAEVWEPEPAHVYSWERGDREASPVARPPAETGAVA